MFTHFIPTITLRGRYQNLYLFYTYRTWIAERLRQLTSTTQLVTAEPEVEVPSGLLAEALLSVRFSAGGFSLPRGNFNVQRHFGCYNWGRREILSSSRQKPGMLLHIFYCTGQPSTHNTEYLAQNVNRVTDEKPRSMRKQAIVIAGDWQHVI